MTNWYEVKLKHDSYTFGDDPTLSSQYIKEIEEWIIEQYNDTDFGVWKRFHRCVYGFRNEEDAMAFKLRWA